MPAQPEVWLRGPVPGISPLLQPVAHSLLQAREELQTALVGFPAELLAARPAGVASVGFHLRHLAGVLDRMHTYARAQPLSEAQLAYLAAEETGPASPQTLSELLEQFSQRVEALLELLRVTPEAVLPESRAVGRASLPSTVVGLLVHAAEHTTRHLGQVLVTARLVQAAFPAG
ncbi:metal-dependent hydrolase [Hymenobacter amundsenii]|uniref:Metal-dependent hydrolase n=1 Tax=Hymenobacter amundsenii TaxID=2006685 RepID=A0A246FLC4_9BACT|nr:DinB family protein [Hymenobacter amundsenii]OWP63557.1 metal-dependent hydrolase [Hymenobacter amundsenii]